MSEGIFVGIGGHYGWGQMGSLVNHAKFGRLRLAIKARIEPRLDREGPSMVQVLVRM